MDVDKIRYLYWAAGLSTHEISKLVGLSQWSVIATMRKYKIPRRKSVDTLKIQFDRSPLSFNKKNVLNSYEEHLYGAGLMLYWAEGAKADHGIVDFANCNEKMTQLFLSMLRQIYQVTENRIRILLYCYSNQKPESLLDFWSKVLKVSRLQFTKPYIRTDFKHSQLNKMPHGLVHVRYNDKRLLKQILTDIDIMASSFRE